MIVVWALYHAIRRPYAGLLLWVWLSIMNPHRLAYGFAHNMPFAQIAAVVLFVSMLVNSSKLERLLINDVTLAMMAFMVWMCVSPLLAFHPDHEFPLWSRALKIQLLVLVALLLVSDRKDLHWLVFVLTWSVGFYTVKGGLFTIGTGGSYRVWGPAGTFIEDNNHMALATIMVIPLFRYLQLQATSKWARRGYAAAIVLSAASALGSHSRGALLAICAMGFFLWLKSRNRALLGIAMVFAVPLVIAVMPEVWIERMQSIKTYDQDASAMGRVNAWWVAWNLAVDRFPIGGGFATWEADVFARYAPDPADIHVAHSIYFQVLGEHGFMGLFLFLAIFGFAWLKGGRIVRLTKGRPDLLWARDLASMAQVCLIGYGVGGAFLSLSYFDLPYYVVIVVVILHELVKKQIAAPPPKVAAVVLDASAPPGPSRGGAPLGGTTP